MLNGSGDHAITADSPYGSQPELVFAGATSFLRRKYTRETDGVDIVVTGIPYDLGTTYRAGARLGPRSIRAASTNLCFGTVWPWGLDPFNSLAVTDWGDIVFDEGYPEQMITHVEAHADALLAGGQRMLTLGGDHFVTLPLLRAHARVHGPLALIHFDAHSDTWRDHRFNHGSVFFHALQEGLIDPDKSIQIGIRTHNQEDHGLTILTAPWVHDKGADAVVEQIAATVGDSAAYLTFDIDCLDPSCAPGTGTPVIGGLETTLVQRIFYGLAGTSINTVGMDLVEVSPPYDNAELTSLAAATLCLDWLCWQAHRGVATAAGEQPAAPDPYQGGSGVRTVRS